jgi:hypothetical protein
VLDRLAAQLCDRHAAVGRPPSRAIENAFVGLDHHPPHHRTYRDSAAPRTQTNHRFADDNDRMSSQSTDAGPPRPDTQPAAAAG